MPETSTDDPRLGFPLEPSPVRRLSYWLRPYDSHLDARRWRWQEPGCARSRRAATVALAQLAAQRCRYGPGSFPSALAMADARDLHWCRDCGAAVISPDQHDAWHEAQR
jgi:hypothetical protein